MGNFDNTLIAEIDSNSIIVGLLSGGLVASIVAFFKAPAEKFALSTEAQAGIIRNLTDENERLILRNERLEEQVTNLREHALKQDLVISKQEDRISDLEEKLKLV